MITVQDCDSWMFRGFGGVIKLLQRRGNEHKDVLIAPAALQRLEAVAVELERSISILSRLPVGEPTIKEIDHELIEGLLMLSQMVLIRATNNVFPKVQSVKAVDILQEELQKLHRLITGLKELNRRLE